ncbi:hypothetical protein IIB79_04600 [candidate division KSB1 bacterium]|nr:hypothetical protein [candidate division KSB1 bacterium]
MKMHVYLNKQVLFIVFLLIFLPMTALAQLISLKTVPIATGNQFRIFPSQNLGMGGVSIAVNDPLLDPFVNPAKGSRIKETVVFISPIYYNISNNLSARTLPLGALFSSENVFGGFSLAIQQLDSSNPDLFQLLSGKYSNNMYMSGIIGTKIPGSDLSIGGSIFLAGLDGIDVVDFLYAGSEKIEQSGYMVDARVGLTGELGKNHYYEALVLLNRFNMEHDVTYNEFPWSDIWPPATRVEKNLDQTNTTGIHLGYVRPIYDTGWLIGANLTGNWKSHPKIPNYEIMNIPRDPGNTSAYDIGLGFSKTIEEDGVTIGLDLIYEPIWSNTWADAAEPVMTSGGDIIPVGGKTIENDFRFSNKLLRIGISKDGEQIGFQLGIQMRSIKYWLDQYNNIESSRRKQKENWSEWTASWSLNFNFTQFSIRYAGQVTTGTGRPGVQRQNNGNRSFAGLDASYILAPSGPLMLQNAHVFTHQVSFSVPISK